MLCNALSKKEGLEVRERRNSQYTKHEGVWHLIIH